MYSPDILAGTSGENAEVEGNGRVMLSAQSTERVGPLSEQSSHRDPHIPSHVMGWGMETGCPTPQNKQRHSMRIQHRLGKRQWSLGACMTQPHERGQDK